MGSFMVSDATQLVWVLSAQLAATVDTLTVALKSSWSNLATCSAS
jgi:Flp pilus assembly pilin Flp